jgi:hypothetical protein
MNYKKVVREIISEIINDQMKFPRLNIMPFDWDDNLMYMPTFILKMMMESCWYVD